MSASSTRFFLKPPTPNGRASRRYFSVAGPGAQRLMSRCSKSRTAFPNRSKGNGAMPETWTLLLDALTLKACLQDEGQRTAADEVLLDELREAIPKLYRDLVSELIAFEGPMQ
jgi:hypothetical protein